MIMLTVVLLGCREENSTYSEVCSGEDADCCALTSCDISIRIGGEQSIDMVLISSGEEPLRRYKLSNEFYMMTTEATQGMFYQLMKYQAYQGYYASSGGSDYPAYYVTWHMAADFANKLTQHHNERYGTELESCYQCTDSGFPKVSCEETKSPNQCSGYRLPTDAEWEYAARSGTVEEFWTGEGQENGGSYSLDICSDSVQIEDGASNPLLSDYSWFCYTNSSQPVAQKLPNGFGVYDLHGNVWEWTADWYGCSFPQAEQDPYCASGEPARVGRGGSYAIFPSYVRSSGRSYADPSRRDSSIGFRVVRNH